MKKAPKCYNKSHKLLRQYAVYIYEQFNRWHYSPVTENRKPIHVPRLFSNQLTRHICFSFKSSKPVNIELQIIATVDSFSTFSCAQVCLNAKRKHRRASTSYIKIQDQKCSRWEKMREGNSQKNKKKCCNNLEKLPQQGKLYSI